MKKILLLLLMFVAISVPSFATNWKYLTTSTDFTEWFIDKDSIKYYKDYADVWEKGISPDGTETVMLNRITTNKMIAIIQGVTYDKNGNVKYSMDYKYYPSYSKILPDSIAEAIYIAVYYS